MLYKNWQEVPRNWDTWPFKYFDPQEIACKGTGELLIDLNAISILDNLRSIIGSPLALNSAYRSKYWNAKCGGSPRSCHLTGKAFDLRLGSHDKTQLIDAAKQAGFTGFGVNYRTFLHVDTGRARRW